MKTNILTIIALAGIIMISSCCNPEVYTELEYTPDAIGDNSSTKDIKKDGGKDNPSPEEDSEYEGKNPQDPSLVGTMAALFKPTYDGVISVTINGESAVPTENNVVIRAVDANHINFYLKNFTLKTQDPNTGNIDEVPVGSIVLKNIEIERSLSPEDGDALFSFSQPVKLTAGDDKTLQWLGPELPEIPITLNGAVLGELIGIMINIDMTDTLGQIIEVIFSNEQEEE